MKKKTSKKKPNLTKKNPKSKKKPAQNNKKIKVSDEEFVEVWNKISKKLSYKFKFGYHDVEDMKQQAAIFALEGLEKYDGVRPLENFLWTHVRNRLFNFKRNNYQRPDLPCKICPFYDKHLKQSTNQCTKFGDKLDCKEFKSWNDRNESKKNIMQLNYIPDHNTVNDDNYSLSFIEDKEILDYIEIHISKEHRESYLKLKHGSKISKKLLDKLKIHISELLNEYKENKE